MMEELWGTFSALDLLAAVTPSAARSFQIQISVYLNKPSLGSSRRMRVIAKSLNTCV